MARPVRLASTVFLAVVFLAGCAAREPVVDLHGKDGGKYQRDLAECRSLAQNGNALASTGADAVVGGILGAVTGVIIGAAVGDPASGAIIGTAAGGSAGILHGGYQAYAGADRTLAQCLRGRGYNVLN